MKKTYIAPQTEAIALDSTTSILLGGSTMTFGDSSKEVDTSGVPDENDEGGQLGRNDDSSGSDLWNNKW